MKGGGKQKEGAKMRGRGVNSKRKVGKGVEGRGARWVTEKGVVKEKRRKARGRRDAEREGKKLWREGDGVDEGRSKGGRKEEEKEERKKV